MSLEKAIEYRKEKRKPYRRSLAFDRSCRNHGNCSYCKSNRTIQMQREMGRLKGQEDEFWCEHSLADPDDTACQACDEAEYFCSDCTGAVE